MPKRILFSCTILHLGDFLYFSPVILLALDQGYEVDVHIDAKNIPQNMDQVLFKEEISSRKVRFFSDAAMLYDFYDIKVIMNPGLFKKTLIAQLQKKGYGKKVIIVFSLPSKYYYLFLLSKPFFFFSGSSLVVRFSEKNYFVQIFDILKVDKKRTFSLREINRRLPVEKQEASDSLIVHIFRNSPDRVFSREKLRELAHWCDLRKKKIIVLYNSKDSAESQMASEFISFCRESKSDVQDIGFTELPKLIGLLRSANLYLGVDHGVSHLAAFNARKGIIIHGGGPRWKNVHVVWRPVKGTTWKNVAKNIISDGDTALIFPTDYSPGCINVIASKINLDTAIHYIESTPQ